LEDGHIWRPRFYDFVVWTEDKRLQKLRYTHENPVKRGLVLEAQQWSWSSFRHYAYGEPGPVVVNEQRIAQLRMREIAWYHQHESPAVENRDGWGSLCRGYAK